MLNRIAASITLALVAALGFTAAPASAADVTFVDSTVTADPSLGNDCTGNGITFVGDVDVAWQINGQPYSYTPQGRTLWLPQGFDGTVTATSTNGAPLVEIDANRSGQSLSWHHVVPAKPCDTKTAEPCDTTTADALAVELSVTKAKVQRQRATIARLRAKLHAQR